VPSRGPVRKPDVGAPGYRGEMNETEPPPIDRDLQVRITEIYASVQGESTRAGRPCTFVRLTGCNLRCVWCDSEYTFTGGQWCSIASVVEEVRALGVPLVEVTGGEPLVQRGAVPLMRALLAAGFEVLLETSGSRDVAQVPDGVGMIVDLKPPDSGEVGSNRWDVLDHLDAADEIKIVCASRRDYEWARQVVRERDLPAVCPVLLSPVWGALEPRDLVDWMLEDRLDVRLNLQQHKVIWSPETTGV
jgi:Organic radical activating enzymes